MTGAVPKRAKRLSLIEADGTVSMSSTPVTLIRESFTVPTASKRSVRSRSAAYSSGVSAGA